MGSALKLTKLDYDIMDKIRFNRFQSQIANALGVSPQKIHYRVNRLVKIGLIERVGRGRYVELRLVLGLNQKLLMGDEGGIVRVQKASERLYLEKFALKCRIFREGEFNVFQKWKLANWEAQEAIVENVLVRKTTKNLIFRFRKLIGDINVDKVAVMKAAKARDALLRAGWDLGPFEVSEKGTYAPHAQSWVQKFLRSLPSMDVRTPDGVVDDSPEGVGNMVEFNDKQAALDILSFPRRLRALEGAVDAQGARVAEFSKLFDRQLDLNFQMQNGMERLMQNVELLNKATVEILSLLKGLREK